MSSRPFSRQYLRKGSMSKWALKPSASVTVWASRLMVSWWLGSFVQRCEEFLHFFFGEAGEDDAVLAGVGVEDVGEGGGDDGEEAVLVEGPGGVLAGAAAAEVFLGDEDLRALVLGLVEDEVLALSTWSGVSRS